MYEMDGILYAGYRLLLTFSTGEKIYDMKHLLDLPVFQPLKDDDVFADIALDFDTVTWCNNPIKKICINYTIYRFT